MTNYKDYSLEKLSEWVFDTLSSGQSSPKEIYATIKESVEEHYYHSKQQTQNAYELLALLNGNGKGHIKEYDDFISNKNDRVNKWILPVEMDPANAEYFITLPDDLLDNLNWKENDTLEIINNQDGSFVIKSVITVL